MDGKVSRTKVRAELHTVSVNYFIRHKRLVCRFSISLLALEKWSTKIFAVFESFVNRIAANRTLSNSGKEGRAEHLTKRCGPGRLICICDRREWPVDRWRPIFRGFQAAGYSIKTYSVKLGTPGESNTF